MAHGLADILAYQAGSGGLGRRTERRKPTGVAECGKYDARILACETPGARSAAKRASLLGSVGVIDGAC